MIDPIDIVIPWVNPFDEEWKKDFYYWKEHETGDKSEGRFRDCNTLKYVLRSIAENCPWCRYVFLILAKPSQIPTWLNVKNDKLKIIYHNEFIPEKYLPTFNSSLINVFIPTINELSENYIFCNDDTFFTKSMTDTFFFKNNKPVYNIKEITQYENSAFGMLIQQDVTFLSKVLNTRTKAFDTFHLPTSYNKKIASFILFLLEPYLDDIFSNSKFRQLKNINEYIFYYACIHLNFFSSNESSRGCLYFFEKNNIRYNFDYPMICINERGEIDNLDIHKLNEILDLQFKDTSFEIK